MGITPHAIGAGRPRRQGNGLVLVLDRLVERALIVVGQAAAAIGLGRFGVELDGRIVVGDGAGIVAPVGKGGTPMDIGPGEVGLGLGPGIGLGVGAELDEAGAGRDLLLDRDIALAGADARVQRQGRGPRRGRPGLGLGLGLLWWSGPPVPRRWSKPAAACSTPTTTPIRSSGWPPFYSLAAALGKPVTEPAQGLK